jgi:hypothetical protein
VIGRSANRGDSLDRKIDEENRATKDFLILENHEEAQEELPKKVKFFYSAAVQNWDAEFYVKVDDNVDLDLGSTSSFISLSCKAMFDPIRVSTMSLSNKCFRSNRGDDCAS